MTPYKMMDSSRPSWLSEPINNIQPFADGTDMDAPITNSGCDDCVVSTDMTATDTCGPADSVGSGPRTGGYEPAALLAPHSPPFTPCGRPVTKDQEILKLRRRIVHRDRAIRARDHRVAILMIEAARFNQRIGQARATYAALQQSHEALVGEHAMLMQEFAKQEIELATAKRLLVKKRDAIAAAGRRG